MSLTAYIVSLGVGLAVGIAYGLVRVQSPAPPIIALLGLLGMLAGEALVSYLRGHQQALAECLHAKSFSKDAAEPSAQPCDPPSTNS